MTETTPAQYEQERLAAYDRILALIQKNLDAVPALLTVSLTQIYPEDARDAATREVWNLLQNGIRHLKDGGQMNSGGSFAEAVAKASLRSSPMAATLGVHPPKYEEHYNSLQFDSGTAEAYWRSRRLLEAVADDATRSQAVMRNNLGFKKPLVAAAQDVSDPELSEVFGAARKTPPGGEDPLMAAVRRQTVLSFNLVSSLYVPLATQLKSDIGELFASPPPPKPLTKGQSFDF